jgi:hypothetical protein
VKRRLLLFLMPGIALVIAAPWSPFSPIDAYRENGPRGRKASCGAAIGGIENDEVCWQVRHDRRLLWVPVTGIGVALLVGGASVAIGVYGFRKARESGVERG